MRIYKNLFFLTRCAVAKEWGKCYEYRVDIVEGFQGRTEQGHPCMKVSVLEAAKQISLS